MLRSTNIVLYTSIYNNYHIPEHRFVSEESLNPTRIGNISENQVIT